MKGRATMQGKSTITIVEGFTMLRFNIPCLSIAFLLFVFSPSPLRAETLNCTPVTSLPATLSTQGIYCLTANLATAQTSGEAITITANNVTLDLNGWKVGGQAAGSGTSAVGIFSSAANVTIKNGIVRGFLQGIYLTGRGAVVRDMLIDQNTYIGIYLNGEGAVAEHNQVVDTGGSTAFTNIDAEGIDAGPSSAGARLSDNTVSGLTATGSGSEYGITGSGPNSTVRDNVVNDSARPTGGGTSYGIYQSGIAVNNTVSNFDIGIYTSAGGIYAHNTAFNCTASYSGGTAGAGNSP
jgi:hypothetical protein